MCPSCRTSVASGAGEAARAGTVLAAPPDDARLLVVDDNEDAAMMLSMLLEASGFELSSENGSRAGL